MIKLIIILIFMTSASFSQEIIPMKKNFISTDNGLNKSRTEYTAVPNPDFKGENIRRGNPPPQGITGNNTSIKWSYTDPASIGDFCRVSANGNFNAVSWNLNSPRISLYNNSSSVPLWEFFSAPEGFLNFITISDNGAIIGAGSYHNDYLFSNSGSVPFLNFDLTRLSDTGTATAIEITSGGNFFVCSASRQDSSTVFGFSFNSANPVWSRKIIPTVTAGGAGIQGIKMSGNDSLIIVNTYAEFFVFKTYTGQLIYQGLINPGSSSSGTQSAQGISGDGKIIATINYSGFLRVYQWNGTAYSFLWANQEPPGQFYNWYTSVDISQNGEYIAAGTLNFVTSSSFDGKIKVFRTNDNGSAYWSYSGCGDEVSALSFSKSGNILAASSWGEFSNSSEDLYLFKILDQGIPFYKLNTPGSLFFCSISDDGKTVTASGKAVHARMLGSGGLLYNIDVDSTGVPVSVNNNSFMVKDYMLNQNFPNPFNPKTLISYYLPENGFTSLKIFDVTGKEVAALVNENQFRGNYEIEFNAKDFNSGVYFYRLESGNFSGVKKLILLK